MTPSIDVCQIKQQKVAWSEGVAEKVGIRGGQEEPVFFFVHPQ